MSVRTTKRWARRLVFVWFGIWLSAALLHCDEVEAAHQQALGADCGHPADHGPAPGGIYKTVSCLVADEPTPASAARLAAPIGDKLNQTAPQVSSSFHLVSPLPVVSVPSEYGAAPPPLAVFLSSSRLLI